MRQENAKANLSQKAWAYFSSGATDMICTSLLLVPKVTLTESDWFYSC